MSKHEAMVEYLKQWPGLRSFLYFNSATDTLGNVSVHTEASDVWEEMDITGHGTKRYDFAVVVMAPQDPGTTYANIVEMEDVESFMAWIRTQNDAGNLPEFEGCQVYGIENLQNMPNLASTNERVAKYMFQCRVRYYE